MTAARQRGFRGYGGVPPPLRWPGDARVAVLIVERILAHITARERVWVARRDEVARHWRELHGLGP